MWLVTVRSGKHSHLPLLPLVTRHFFTACPSTLRQAQGKGEYQIGEVSARS